MIINYEINSSNLFSFLILLFQNTLKIHFSIIVTINRIPLKNIIMRYSINFNNFLPEKKVYNLKKNLKNKLYINE